MWLGEVNEIARCPSKPQTFPTGIEIEVETMLLKLAGRTVRRLLIHGWVHPLEQLLVRLRATCPPRVFDAVESLLNWTRCFGLLVANSLVVKLYCLRGPDWSVIYVGEGDSLNELSHALFLEPANAIALARLPLWRVPSIVRRFLGKGFLVVSELNRLIPWQPRANYVFASPPVVRQVLDTTQPPDVLYDGLKKELRRHLRRIKDMGFTYEVSRQSEDFDLFYHQMYLPFIQQRYKEQATITNHSLARRYFDHGELVFVRRNGQRIGGTLVLHTRDKYVAMLVGFCPEYADQARQGALLAMYWFDICRAWELGRQQVDWGGSYARTRNGVFTFKQQWGTRLLLVQGLHVKRFFAADQISPDLCCHLNHQGFLTEREGGFWQVVLETDQGRAGETENHCPEQQMGANGIAGLMVLGPPSAARLASNPVGKKEKHR